MPGIPVKYDVTDQKSKINDLADAERKPRNALIDTYWKYYNGEHTRPLKTKPGQPNFNVILNVSGQAIDNEVAFFAPEPPTFELPGGNERSRDDLGKLATVKSPQQEQLDTFWKANDLEQLITDIALSGFISGHNFVRLFVAEDGALPTVALLDPRKVQVFWDISNIRRVLFYRLSWVLGDEERFQDIVPNWLLNGLTSPNVIKQVDSTVETAPDTNRQWKILEYVKKNQKYELQAQDAWPFDFAPIVDWKNGHAPHEYYGHSDLKHADVNDAINLVASNANKIIFYYGGPWTVVTGTDQQAADAGPGVITYFPDPATKVQNVEMQSDLGNSLNLLETLRSSFFSQMRVIDTSTQKDKLGQMTNFGVRVLYKDQLDANGLKRSIYGAGLCEVSRRALVLMGVTDAQKPTATWADPLPTNRLEIMQAVKIENDLGKTSDQTLLEAMDRDPQVEAERKAEQGSNETDQMVNFLDRFGRSGGFGGNSGFGGQRQPFPPTSQRPPAA